MPAIPRSKWPRSSPRRAAAARSCVVVLPSRELTRALGLHHVGGGIEIHAARIDDQTGVLLYQFVIEVIVVGCDDDHVLRGDGLGRERNARKLEAVLAHARKGGHVRIGIAEKRPDIDAEHPITDLRITQCEWQPD